MSDEYNIFISWSGSRSKWVAEALRKWLPVILQTAKPWMSDTDIDKGTRGLNEVSSGLQGMKVGIVCLTPENLNEPWILYEAGALSKTIDDKSRLCTYLLGELQFQDVKVPLGMFQATKPDKQDTQKLVHTINKAVSDKPVPEADLDYLFDRLWPDLETKLKTLPASSVAATKRSTDDMVTELLEIARGEANHREGLQSQLIQIRRFLSALEFERGFAQALVDKPATLADLAGSAAPAAAPATLEAELKQLKAELLKLQKEETARAIRKARESKDRK